MSLGEFLSMGGYAEYVWSSYGIATVVLVANIVIPVRRHRQMIARIRRRIRQEQNPQ
jgi:heme exporter protein D